MLNGVKCLGAFTAATFRPSAAVHSPQIRETDVRRLYALISLYHCITHSPSSKCLLFENIQHNKKLTWQQLATSSSASSRVVDRTSITHSILSFQLSSLFYALICSIRRKLVTDECVTPYFARVCSLVCNCFPTYPSPPLPFLLLWNLSDSSSSSQFCLFPFGY